MKSILFTIILAMPIFSFAQTPPLEPGVSLELAKWRAAHYSDVRYKLNLTLEKMSPVLKGTIEIRVKLSQPPALAGGGTSAQAETRPVGSVPPIILDWRKIRGHDEKSTVSNVTINGKAAKGRGYEDVVRVPDPALDHIQPLMFIEWDEHLVFPEGVIAGENIIKLDFTSPILTSGSAIMRYVDKEDGSEYIYSLFVPSDASTAFPVFDQPDLKARFKLRISSIMASDKYFQTVVTNGPQGVCTYSAYMTCDYWETKPISTYVFAFAAGPWEKVSMAGAAATKSVPPALAGCKDVAYRGSGSTVGRVADTAGRPVSVGAVPPANAGGTDKTPELHTNIYVRKSQAAKFKPHAAEVFRLNREAVKYFEQYFNYKFPFPKYDLVLIPEFPFGGMEHAGATFLRESSIIFPQEPTKNDYISRATLIFHETAHQWFGDTVTMRWFDDLWLKEGFATFMAYKAMEKIMPESNAWKVFYERVKQTAYQTDSTRGTTAIYQPIANLSAAKSAYGNIVYNKAPAFLRQAEFYLGEDKFQTAVRAFLKKHEFGNAGWEDLVREFVEIGWKRPTDCMQSVEECKQNAKNQKLLVEYWAKYWVWLPGVFKFRVNVEGDILPDRHERFSFEQQYTQNPSVKGQGPIHLPMKFKYLAGFGNRLTQLGDGEVDFGGQSREWIPSDPKTNNHPVTFILPNYGDYGYGIFLLDEKSRDYVLKNIQYEKDPFLRAMMWGALWDSVREGELDPRAFVELVVNVLQKPAREQGLNTQRGDHAEFLQKPAREQGLNTQRSDQALANAQASALDDESTVALLLNRVSTAMNYYMSEPRAVAGGLTRSGNSSDLKARLQPPATAGGSDLRSRVEDMLIDRMQNAPTLGQRITFYRAFLSIAASENGRRALKEMLKSEPSAVAGGLTSKSATTNSNSNVSNLQPPATAGGSDLPLMAKDKFDIVTRLLILGDPDAPKVLAELEKTETSDDAKRYAYAAKAGIPTAGNKAKYWNDFIDNKQISESWIEAAMGPWNSIRQSELTLPYLQKALQELPNHKRSRKIFFVNGWLGAFIGGQRSEEALGIVNKFLADNPNLDNDLRLKVLENVDLIERAVKIRKRFP